MARPETWNLEVTCVGCRNFEASGFLLWNVMSDIAKKRKGGLRQRIAEERSERQRTSAIATYLLKQYSWGKMSVQQVQEVASLVLQDMNEFQSDIIFPQLVSLARFGSSGQHPNNMSRDMTRFIEAIPKLPPSSEIPMPTQKGEERTGLLLPHEIFSHMYENNRSAFNKLFIPDGPSSLKKFWNQCRGAACLQNQPVLVNLNPSKCIPIGIHGDEVPIAGRGKCWVKMALVFTWFSLVANQMPTKESLLWIWAGSPQHFLSGENGTMNTFYMILAWSMDCLFSGLWPTRDHRGVAYHPGSKEYRKANSQLAGGFYCTLVGLCGDLDYFAKFLSMPHWGSHNPCGWCGCSSLESNHSHDFNLVRESWEVSVPNFSLQKHDRTHSSTRSYACEIFRIPAVFPWFLLVASMSWDLARITSAEHPFNWSFRISIPTKRASVF